MSKEETVGVSKKRQTAPRITAEVIRAIKIKAAETDRQYHEVIEKALWHYLRCPHREKF